MTARERAQRWSIERRRAAHRSPPGAASLRSLAAIVGGAVVVVTACTAASFFVWDDFVNFEEARGVPLSLSYLTRATPATCCLGIRVAPFQRLAYWLIQAHAPLQFGVARAVTISIFALTILAFYALVVEIFGKGRGSLVVTVVYAASTVHVGVLVWFAAALDRVPATLFSLICMHAYVRFSRTGRRSYLLASVGSLGVALLFHVEAALVPLFLVLLRVFVLRPDESCADAITDVKRDWRAWLAYVVPTGGYLLIYLGRYHSAVGRASIPLFGRYLLSRLFSVVVPGIIGLQVPSGRSAAGVVAIGLSLLALFVVATVALVRRRDAWRAGAFLALAFLLNALLVGLSRVGDSASLGPDTAAHTLRYSEQMSWLYPLALAAAFLGTRPAAVAVPGDVPAGWRARFASPRLSDSTAVRVATTVFVVFSLVGDLKGSAPANLYGHTAGVYMANVEAGLAQAGATARPVALLDGVTPYQVVPGAFAPYNRLSRVLPLIGDRLSFDAHAPDLYETSSDGRLHPVTWFTAAASAAAAAVASGTAGVLPPQAAETSTGELCVRADASRPLVVWSLGVAAPSSAEEYLRVRARAPGAGPLPLIDVAVNRGDGFKLGPDPVATLSSDAADIVFDLGTAGVAQVALSLPQRSTVCLDDLEAGLAVPR